MPVTNSHHHCSWLSYTIAMIGEYVTNCCLYSAHKLCRTTWHSGLLAQLEQQLLWEFVAFHTSNDSKSLWTHVEEMMDLWAIVKNTLKLPPALIAQQISPTFHMGLVRKFIANNDELFPKWDVKSFYDFGQNNKQEWLIKEIVLNDGY